MTTRMSTYDKIKEVLDANSALLKKDFEILSSKIEANRQISILKFRELKEDTEELKLHAKETNGTVKEHTKAIVVIEEKQHQESKRQRRIWACSLTFFTVVLGGMITYMVQKFS